MEEAPGDIHVDGIVFYKQDIDAGELFQPAEAIFWDDHDLGLEGQVQGKIKAAPFFGVAGHF